MNPDHRFGERYVLDRQLWFDGPHEGWLALDRPLGRKVVINFPYRTGDDSQFLERVRLRARLRHANLIPVYDLGETTDGRPFFTEPHIEATDLRTLLDRHDERAAATLPRLVAYLQDACKAIAFLHANGFLHLEVHPRNIVVVPASDEVFVVLGHRSLAPARSDSETLEEGAVAIGVLAYMAPEQLNPGALGPPDVLTDVYGLGRILFEILYDDPPNAKRGAPMQETLMGLAGRKGPPPRGVLGDRVARYRPLAQRLEPVCLRALEHDRNARQSSVSAFVEDIENASTG